MPNGSSAAQAGPMTADEFIPWAMDQGRDRYELDAGRVVAMAPERAVHAEAKLAATVALHAAVRAAGLDCWTFADGMAVRIDEGTVYEPDASVRCGARLPPDATEFSDPVVVVEVVSPSSKSIDSGRKLREYFRLPSVAHYLVIVTDTRVVIHHRRTGPDAIETRVMPGGTLVLDPPGLRVAATDMLPPA